MVYFNPLLGKIAILLALAGYIAIRAPYGNQSRTVKVVEDRRGTLETVLLVLAMAGSLAPLVWVFSDWLSIADYPLTPLNFGLGLFFASYGLVLFKKSHNDLGKNWSVTLELREGQQLVKKGLYSKIRHPMYAAILTYALGQALLVPNWIAGPAYLWTFLLLVALRVGPEEQMMIDKFGDEYRDYQVQSKRLIPYIW